MLEAEIGFVDLLGQEEAEMILLLSSGMTLLEYEAYRGDVLKSDTIPS